jgi:hypothetical protein
MDTISHSRETHRSEAPKVPRWNPVQITPDKSASVHEYGWIHLDANRKIGQMYGVPSTPQLDRATGCMQLSHIFAVGFRKSTSPV